MTRLRRMPATIDDLYQVRGKAELVSGKIVYFAPKGGLPGHSEGEIFISLRLYAARVRHGIAVGANRAFCVELPERQSFSPDAAYFVGKHGGMKFFKGAPNFAVEVRGELDYGSVNETRRAAKRADYFTAGTLVVWDVDLLSADVVRSYHADNPEQPTCFQRGETANAEPAVPAWSMPVDDLFYTEPS